MEQHQKIIGIDISGDRSTATVISGEGFQPYKIDAEPCDACLSISAFTPDDERRQLINSMASRGVRVSRLLSNVIAASLADRERLSEGGRENTVVCLILNQESIEAGLLAVDDGIFELKYIVKRKLKADPVTALTQYLQIIAGKIENLEEIVLKGLKEMEEKGLASFQGQLKIVKVNSSKLEELCLAQKDNLHILAELLDELAKKAFSDLSHVSHVLLSGQAFEFSDIEEKVKKIFPKAHIALDEDGSYPSKGASLMSAVLRGGGRFGGMGLENLLTLDVTMTGVYFLNAGQKQLIISPGSTIPLRTSVISLSSHVFQQMEDHTFRLVQEYDQSELDADPKIYNVDIDANGIVACMRDTRTLPFTTPKNP